MPSSVWFGQAYGAALRSFRPLDSINAAPGCQKSSPSYQFNSLNFDSKKLSVRSVEDHLKSLGGRNKIISSGTCLACHLIWSAISSWVLNLLNNRMVIRESVISLVLVIVTLIRYMIAWKMSYEPHHFKATRGDLNANFDILFWPSLVALIIWAEPPQPHGPTMWWSPLTVYMWMMHLLCSF